LLTPCRNSGDSLSSAGGGAENLHHLLEFDSQSLPIFFKHRLPNLVVELSEFVIEIFHLDLHLA
jgi:hypothetical protein